MGSSARQVSQELRCHSLSTSAGLRGGAGRSTLSQYLLDAQEGAFCGMLVQNLMCDTQDIRSVMREKNSVSLSLWEIMGSVCYIRAL